MQMKQFPTVAAAAAAAGKRQTFLFIIAKVTS